MESRTNLQKSGEPLEALKVTKPKISLVRSARESSLFRWAEAKGLDLG